MSKSVGKNDSAPFDLFNYFRQQKFSKVWKEIPTILIIWIMGYNCLLNLRICRCIEPLCIRHASGTHRACIGHALGKEGGGIILKRFSVAFTGNLSKKGQKRPNNGILSHFFRIFDGD